MRLIIALVLGISVLVNAKGLQVMPMEQFVQAGQSVDYIASNQLDDAIAVQVVCETWTMDENGKEISTPTDDLIPNPTQFVLLGNSYKKIKVSFRNATPPPAKEICYRVTIRELPISLKPPVPGSYEINYASAYRTSFYVLPKQISPALEVRSGAIINNKLNVAILNKGNVHVHLKSPVLRFTCEGGAIVERRDASHLKGFEGENIHAGLARNFEIDLQPLDLPGKVVGVEASFLPEGPTKGISFNLLTP